MNALFSWCSVSIGHYGATDGGIAGAVVLLLWLFLTNLVILFGAEVNTPRPNGRFAVKSGTDTSKPHGRQQRRGGEPVTDRSWKHGNATRPFIGCLGEELEGTLVVPARLVQVAEVAQATALLPALS